MESGLIRPPVRLNIFVIKSTAPDIPLAEVVGVVLALVWLMLFARIVICASGIAGWLPNPVLAPRK
jgi:C4-dicarboxylate transporter DctM subunit